MALIRAVYHNGQLQLLDTVELQEGQEVQLQIVEEQTPLEDLIGDMLVRFEPDNTDIDEDAVVQELDRALAGKRPLSEIVIEERLAGR